MSFRKMMVAAALCPALALIGAARAQDATLPADALKAPFGAMMQTGAMQGGMARNGMGHMGPSHGGTQSSMMRHDGMAKARGGMMMKRAASGVEPAEPARDQTPGNQTR